MSEMPEMTTSDQRGLLGNGDFVSPLYEDRPWGSYTVLADETTHKVKSITVAPGQRLSYQRHSHRSEHWFVISGDATVTLDGVEFHVLPGHYADIPRGVRTASRTRAPTPSSSSRCSTATTSVRTTSSGCRTTTDERSSP